MATRKKQVFNARKEVRKLARERVGTVPAERVIVPKSERKPKHKKPPGTESEEAQ